MGGQGVRGVARVDKLLAQEEGGKAFSVLMSEAGRISMFKISRKLVFKIDVPARLQGIQSFNVI